MGQKWLPYKDFSMIFCGVDLNSTSSVRVVPPPDWPIFAEKQFGLIGFDLHIGGHPFGQSISKIVDKDSGFEISLQIRNGNLE
jgi:hypothetical protein